LPLKVSGRGGGRHDPGIAARAVAAAADLLANPPINLRRGSDTDLTEGGGTTVVAAEDSAFGSSYSGPYYVDVYAMDRHAYEDVMTGSGSEFLPVPPSENVVGGFGAVGAWVIRSTPLPQGGTK
jgi:hypothetical protein